MLDVLRAAGEPVGVQQVASQTGLHPNTARFHLDNLVEAGLATREPQQRATPGRPSMAYQATAGDGIAGHRRYRLLAEILTTMISAVMPHANDAAVEGGREWGRYLAGVVSPYQRLDAAGAMAKLTGTMDEIGFAPEMVAQSGGYRLLLHQCPFREVAERHQDVVCALHLGLMQGVLAQLRAPVTADRLRPFAEPSVCVAEFSAEQGQRAGSGGRRQRDGAGRRNEVPQ